MQLIFDYDIDSDGNIRGFHSIDTADPAVRLMLANMKANPAMIATAGYARISKHPAHIGKTRFQVIQAEAVKANDVALRASLGV